MADIVQTCTQCGKKFLIIDQEQKFLKGKGLLLPMLCPDDRQVKRIKDREKECYIEPLVSNVEPI